MPRKKSYMGFLGWLNRHEKLSGQLPVAPMQVVYTKSGTNLADCFVLDETAAVDSQMYWASVETKGNYILWQSTRSSFPRKREFRV